jgi:hypothetical protein
MWRNAASCGNIRALIANYGNMQGLCGSSVKTPVRPDPVWKPVRPSPHQFDTDSHAHEFRPRAPSFMSTVAGPTRKGEPHGQFVEFRFAELQIDCLNPISKCIVSPYWSNIVSKELQLCNHSKPQGLEEFSKHEAFRTDRSREPASCAPTQRLFKASCSKTHVPRLLPDPGAWNHCILAVP